MAHTRPASSPSLRLEYLDGLRGLSALYVVLNHAYLEVAHGDGASRLHPWLAALSGWMDYGHYAVAVFIVLSGYCLMLPAVRASGTLPGGFWPYLGRRLRRIAPPYYAALALSLLIIALTPEFQQRSGVRMDDARPAFRLDVIVSHLLLAHNLSPDWLYRINPPMWSVAIEWQIYFLFPALLLPVWRRWGAAAALAAATAFAVLTKATVFLPPASGLAWLSWPCAWYLVLFTMGMVAAAASVRLASGPLTRWVPWGLCAGSLAVLFVAWLVVAGRTAERHQWPGDVLVGVATACLLVHCTRGHLAGREPAAMRLLSGPRVVGLGGFSYSLYLSHLPLLSLFHLQVRRWEVSPDAHLALQLLVAVPLAVVAAYLFYRVFERPFTTGRARREKAKLLVVQAARVTVLTEETRPSGTGRTPRPDGRSGVVTSAGPAAGG